MGERVHPDGAVFEIIRVLRHLAREHGYVARSRILSGGGQARAVLIRRVFHAERGGARVHAFDEVLLRARDVFRQRHGGIVCAGDDRRAQQVFKLVFAACVEQRLRAAHPCRVFRAGYRIAQTNGTVFERFEGEQQRHQLRYAGDGTALVGVMLADDLPGRFLQQQITRRFQNKRRVGF